MSIKGSWDGHNCPFMVNEMKLRSLRIGKLRCFSDFELSFKEADDKPEIIYLAGENGSGKSTVLWALAAGINRILNKNSPDMNQFSKAGNFSIEIELSGREQEIVNTPILGYQFIWDNGVSSDRWLSPANVGPRLTEYRKNKDEEDRTEIGTLEYLQADRFISTEHGDTLRTVGAGEVETRSCHGYLNLTQSRRSGRAAESKYRDVLRQYGTLLQMDIRNRTRVYDYVKDSQTAVNETLGNQMRDIVLEIEKESHYERIRHAIARYLPGITLSAFDDQSANPPSMILRTLNNKSVEIAKLSSGEFQIVVWLIDLIQKDLRNSIILWDEPEQHLHPSLSMRIPDMLREFCPGSQIWIATQSPFIIASARTQDRVYYLERNEAGLVEVLKEADSKIQAFRRLTPNGFLATWGKQVIFVEGKQDITFFQNLLDHLGIDAIAAQLTSKPGLKKLDSILREIKDIWDVPLAVAVVDRDYYSPEDFDPYPLITYYSEKSCDLEGLFLEPVYLKDSTLVAMAKHELTSKEIAPSSDPMTQLIEEKLSDSEFRNILYREHFEHTLGKHIGDVLREGKLDINDLQRDASNRLLKVANSFIPSLSMENLSFNYPDVLKWCKGKRLLSEIGALIGMKRRKKFFSVLSSRVAEDPPEHLVTFLRKCSSEFNESSS